MFDGHFIYSTPFYYLYLTYTLDIMSKVSYSGQVLYMSNYFWCRIGS